jgi:acyl-CoA synthetase (AMP-forming)/AMP-acid ligase II
VRSMLVGDIVKRQARINSKKIGLVDGEKKFTYKEINERVNRLANALIGVGLRKGNKVAFMANNCHEYVEAYFATGKAGLIIVPINARFNAAEVAYALNHSESDVIIFQEEFDEVVKKARPHLTTIKYFIKIDGVENDVRSYEAFLSLVSSEEPKELVDIDDVAMIMYTSGATGEAKGVIITQRNLMATANTQTLELRIVHEDINLLVMPLFHAGGLWPTLSHFYRGAKTILLPRFDEDRVLQIVEKEKVTFLNLVPTTLRRLTIRPDLKNFNLDSLRVIMYAGAPIPLHQLKEAMNILGPHRFYTGLGATEAGTGGMLSLTTAEHASALDGPLADKLGSVGRDSMGVEVKIVDDNGMELPAGKIGEIIAKGDEIALGYWKMPEETSQTFKNGWLHTGDLGYRDEDGYVFVVGRKKDIIISGGENISSLEVEDTISQHPAVAEVAVIGVPDELWGEAVKALIILRPACQSGMTPEEIISFCRERLAPYKCPKSVNFLTDLPKNPAGKIMKGELKQQFKS